ncbi:hypothetical protein AVEN_208045-1 [Araneus ventricosus]|uniref:Uncharacterized protein n=1 Tax=Araneus ventricosus TaxID=182803 RepID=A0A4Y2F0G1_ARAVE|nr:hypothetical protein AVEN_208045-1 [Araneus ventricosus]
MDHGIRRWKIPKNLDPVLALILDLILDQSSLVNTALTRLRELPDPRLDWTPDQRAEHRYRIILHRHHIDSKTKQSSP